MPEPRSPIRIALDEAAFRQLCAGAVVELRGHGGDQVQLILSDIGLVPMLRAVVDGALPEDLRRRGEGGGG